MALGMIVLKLIIRLLLLSYYYPVIGFGFCKDPLDCKDTFVDVYSVKRGVWKRVDNSPYQPRYSHSSGAFVNGAIHWLANNREIPFSSLIIAFNFAHEVFDEIPAPKDDASCAFVFYKLGVLGGCLCMIHDEDLYVWIMKECGVVDSWTKFCIETDDDLDIRKALCYIGDEEVVCVEYDCWTVYNMKDKSFRDMVVDGALAWSLYAGVFVESLVSPTMN